MNTAEKLAQAAEILARPDYCLSRAHRIGGTWTIHMFLRDSSSPSGKRGIGPVFDDTPELEALFKAAGRTSPLSPTEF